MLGIYGPPCINNKKTAFVVEFNQIKIHSPFLCKFKEGKQVKWCLGNLGSTLIYVEWANMLALFAYRLGGGQVMSVARDWSGCCVLEWACDNTAVLCCVRVQCEWRDQYALCGGAVCVRRTHASIPSPATPRRAAPHQTYSDTTRPAACRYILV